MGQAERFATEVPPVIEREAQERVAATPRWPSRAAQVESVPGRGLVLRPTLVADLPDDSPVLSEEIFGPLLALTRVKSVDEACDIVDALAVRPHGRPLLAQPRDRGADRGAAPVGNLYVNRGITGAMVGASPWRPPPLRNGSKAGGPDYLLQFVEPRVLTENTMRHGIPVD